MGGKGRSENSKAGVRCRAPPLRTTVLADGMETVPMPSSFLRSPDAPTSRDDQRKAVGEGWLDATLAIHGGVECDPKSGSILTPIVQSATYVQESVQAGNGARGGHTYSRASNPTVQALERAIAAVEGGSAHGGDDRTTGAACFSSGLSAETTLFLALLRAGDEIIVSDVVYGGTVRLLRQILSGLGIVARFVDTSDAGAVERAITANTKLVFVETPANPTLKLTDIGAIAAVTRRAGIPLAVDNTFLTPVIQRPLDLGADICVYSTTKHIEGHNATIGGALTARDPALIERFKFVRKTLGTIQSPFEAWLTLRGLKTLPLRIREHSRIATIVARYLQSHELVERVWYPGLESFPQSTLARAQHIASGEALHGGVIAFEVKGGVAAGVRLLNSLKLISLAESLGAVESLVTHPVTMTHGDVPEEQRAAVGITDGLIRLSVGLEHAIDIIADLEQALAASTSLESVNEHATLTARAEIGEVALV